LNKSYLLSAVRALPLLASFTLLGWSPANAALVFEILRINDTTAQITGTGSIDIVGTGTQSSGITPYWLSLDGATSAGDPGYDTFSGTLTLGGVDSDGVFARKTTNDFWLTFGATPVMGSAVTGLVTATLDVETWAVVGTTGTVSAGSNMLGSYTVVSSFSAVPIPAAVWLFGSGLLGLAGIARRKKAA